MLQPACVLLASGVLVCLLGLAGPAYAGFVLGGSLLLLSALAFALHLRRA